MGAHRAAVVGVGQTKHRSSRKDVSMAGLVREAAMQALEDAGMTWADIDAVVIGKAPDMFEGVAMPELYLADALGAVGKPMMRVHTAGSVGGSTAIVATKLVTSGVHQRVLTVAFEKQSESNATWGLSVSQPFSAALASGAPLDRPGYPVDVAAGALYLASDDASYVTGHALAVDAGYTTVGGPSPFATGDYAQPRMLLGRAREVLS